MNANQIQSLSQSTRLLSISTLSNLVLEQPADENQGKEIASDSTFNPILPLKFIEKIFDFALMAAVKPYLPIESTQQLLLFMNVNSMFYNKIKKILENNVTIYQQWNRDKTFINIMNRFPEKTVDSNSNEDEFPGKWCRKKYFEIKYAKKLTNDEFRYRMEYLFKKTQHIDIDCRLLKLNQRTQIIFNALLRKTDMKSFSFSMNKKSSLNIDEFIDKLVCILNNNKEINEIGRLCLRKIYLKNSHIKKLAKALSGKNIGKLLLSDNKFKPSCTEILTRHFKNIKVRSLHIEHNKLNDKNIENLTANFPEGLLKLYVAHNNISEDGINFLINKLRTSEIKKLSLGNNNFSENFKKSLKNTHILNSNNRHIFINV